MTESARAEATLAPMELEYATLGGAEVPAPTLENVYLLQQAADYRVGFRTLRRAGIGDIVWGAICLLLGFAAMRISMINLGLMLLGLLLFGIGVWTVAAPSPIGMIFDGCALIAVGVWNIFISGYAIAHARPGTTPNTFFPILAIAQMGWGISRIKRYRRFADASTLRPSAEMVKWLDATITSVTKAKPASDPGAIRFQFKGFNSYQEWKGQLSRDLAILVRSKPQEVLFLARTDIEVTPTGKVLLGKTRKASFSLGRIKGKGLIAPDSLERLEKWKAQLPEATPLAAQET